MVDLNCFWLCFFFSSSFLFIHKNIFIFCYSISQPQIVIFFCCTHAHASREGKDNEFMREICHTLSWYYWRKKSLVMQKQSVFEDHFTKNPKCIDKNPFSFFFGYFFGSDKLNFFASVFVLVGWREYEIVC